MKVLTIFSAIFIPLTFIVGVYGMNFDYIPFLRYRYAYFILWGIMIAIVILMLFLLQTEKMVLTAICFQYTINKRLQGLGINFRTPFHLCNLCN